MSDKLIISKPNEVYIHINCEPSTAYELRDHFSFMVPNYWFTPAFKNKLWDGKIRLFNILTGLIYAGLQQQVEEFCQKRGYEIEYNYDILPTEFPLEEAQKYIKTLKLPFEPHKHQMEAFLHAVRTKRAVLLSPTASGKSLIAYILTRYFDAKTLIIVPTTGLVSQMCSDFIEYGMDNSLIHKVYAGQEKETECSITISTWQSIYKLPKEYFKQFHLVVGDECDQFEAKSLTSIMTKLQNCVYRFGITGTLKGTQTNQLVLEGLFGPVKTVATTTELINKNILSNLLINCILLSYPDVDKKLNRDYRSEIEYIIAHEGRNRFIKNLTLDCKGNTLVLFQFVEKHGKLIYEAIAKEAGDRPVFFVWSKVKGDDRDEIRKIVEKETNAIIVASSVFVRGVNIKSLRHLIFTSPTKARRTVLQSIGRTLRKSDMKNKAILYDIVDDLSYKKRKNYALQHYIERAAIYAEERFKVKLHKVNLEGGNS